MTEEQIKSCAEQVRAHIQTLPNYSLASAKMVAETLGLHIKPDDIPLFIKTLLRAPYPSDGNYAYLHFTHTVRDCHKAYEEVVRIARNNMVDRIIIERKTATYSSGSSICGNDHSISKGRPDSHKTENIKILESEVEIRHYDENSHLIIGHIYPIPREDGINVFIQADQWIRELPKREKMKYENGKSIRILEDGTEVPFVPEQRQSPPARTTWNVEFFRHPDYLQSTSSSAPRSAHADAIKEIIIKHLPNLEPYLF